MLSKPRFSAAGKVNDARQRFFPVKERVFLLFGIPVVDKIPAVINE